MNSLSFLVNLLPNSIQSGMYGVVYTQFAADIVTIVITSILAVKVNKQLNNKSLENKKSKEMSLRLQLKN